MYHLPNLPAVHPTDTTTTSENRSWHILLKPPDSRRRLPLPPKSGLPLGNRHPAQGPAPPPHICLSQATGNFQGPTSFPLCILALHFSPSEHIPPPRALPSSTLLLLEKASCLTPFFIVPLFPCHTDPLPRAVSSGSRQQRPKSWSRGLSRTISAPRPQDPAREDGSPFHSP